MRVRRYLAIVGAGLLLQGAASLVLLEGFDVDPARSDVRGDKNLVLTVLESGECRGALGLRPVTMNSLSFDPAPHQLLGEPVARGIVVHDPFGLRLGWGENGFHLIVGPVALVLVLLEARGAQRPVLSEAT